MSLKWPPKDKDEFLDYSIDWSRALDSGEVIQSVSWLIVDENRDKVNFRLGETVSGLQNAAQTNTSTVATVYLRNGEDNREYTIYCRVTTNQSKVKERAVKLRIREYN